MAVSYTHLDVYKRQTLPVDNYREITGAGIAGRVEGHLVLLGSRKFVAGTDTPAKSVVSSVFVSIDHKMKGSFLMQNQYLSLIHI